MGFCKGLRLRFTNDHIGLRRLARIDTLMTLFVLLFVEHCMRRMLWYTGMRGSRVVDGCHALPTTCFPQASVELDLRTSYSIAISVSHTDPIKDPAPNFLYRGIIKSTAEPIWAIKIG